MRLQTSHYISGHYWHGNPRCCYLYVWTVCRLSVWSRGLNAVWDIKATEARYGDHTAVCLKVHGQLSVHPQLHHYTGEKKGVMIMIVTVLNAKWELEGKSVAYVCGQAVLAHTHTCACLLIVCVCAIWLIQVEYPKIWSHIPYMFAQLIMIFEPFV